MGAYLSQPKTDKVSTDDIGERLIVGASSMQGWRNSQEDAHNAIIDFDADTSFFAVYDGHGGAEVATYCADRLPDFLKQLDLYRDGKFDDALKRAFLEFDRTLLESEVVEVLKILAGEKNVDDSDNMEFEEDEEDLVELHEESHMPLNKLFEKYHGHPAMPGLQNLKNEAGGGGNGAGGSKPQSPFLRGRRTAAIVAQATNKALMDPDSKPAGSSTSAAAASMTASNDDDNPSSSGSSKSLEKRAAPLEDSTVSSSSSSSSSKANNNDNVANNINSNSEAEAEAATLNGTITSGDDKSAEATASATKADSSQTAAAANESGQNGSVTSTEKNITSSAATSSKAATSANVDEATVSGSNDAAKQNGTHETVAAKAAQADGTGISSTTNKTTPAKANELIGMPTIDDDEEDAEYEFNKQAADADSTDTDDDEDDDEAEGEDIDADAEIDDDEDEDADSEEFDDEADEDEDDEEVLIANQQFCANMIEEPGKDSGCTAVVALLCGRDLYVANAGDSRCVVCRNGKAIEMSLDHKPEDYEESARIIKAGGRVTQDGRVNGGLNLSRAIGDHAYKMNADLPLEEQMISAKPDIKKLIITPEDEFMVLACDGIWNFMSSEEVVEFVRARLVDEKKRVSEICEELFDHCLAPDTMGDGTGCDNMTAVIVRFQPKILELPTRLNPEETEDALLKKEAEKVKNAVDGDEIVDDVDEENQQEQKKAQKRLAEDHTNEAEQAMKTKRLKTDIIDGSGDDTDKPNNANAATVDSHNKMETEDSPVKSAATTTTNNTTTAAAAATKAEEQNQCDSVASTVQQQQQPPPPTAVSTT